MKIRAYSKKIPSGHTTGITTVISLLVLLIACKSDADKFTMDDFPIGKLILSDFLSDQRKKGVSTLLFDSSTGEVLDLKFDSVKKMIAIDTCRQHLINRGRGEYARRIVNIGLINYRINNIKDSGYNLTFLDDTLASVRLNFADVKDQVLVKYFIHPTVDTIRYSFANEPCKGKEFRMRDHEIKYAEGDLGMRYSVSEHAYGGDPGKCFVSTTVFIDLYSFRARKIMSGFVRTKH